MVGSCDRNCIDIFVLEELADIDIGFGFGETELLHVADALIQNALIDVAERSNFRTGNFRKAVKMIIAAAAYAANREANTIIGTEYSSAQSECCCSNGDCFPRSLKKISAIDRHMTTPWIGIKPASRIV